MDIQAFCDCFGILECVLAAVFFDTVCSKEMRRYYFFVRSNFSFNFNLENDANFRANVFQLFLRHFSIGRPEHAMGARLGFERKKAEHSERLLLSDELASSDQQRPAPLTIVYALPRSTFTRDCFRGLVYFAGIQVYFFVWFLRVFILDIFRYLLLEWDFSRRKSWRRPIFELPTTTRTSLRTRNFSYLPIELLRVACPERICCIRGRGEILPKMCLIINKRLF